MPTLVPAPPPPRHPSRDPRPIEGDRRRRTTVRSFANAVIGLLVSIGSGILPGTPSAAQSYGYPSPPSQPGGGVGRQGSNFDTPQTNLQPIGPPASSSGGLGGPSQPGPSQPGGFRAGGGQPGQPAPRPPSGGALFDPYATNSGGGNFSGGPRFGSAPPPPPPGVNPSQYPNGSFVGRLLSLPASSPSPVAGSVNHPPPTFGGYGIGGGQSVPAPDYGAPGSMSPSFGGPGYGGRGFESPSYPPSIYPSSTPSTLFPSGLLGPGGMWPGSGPSQIARFRFIHGPRLRHGMILGGDENSEVGTNDTDVSVAFAFPNFLYSTQPLYVVPSFGLHLWDGPQSEGSTATADLPSSVYDGFLDFGWQSDPNQIFGAELGVRVGAFTDFDLFNSESIRVRGKGLGSFRLTPASTLKAGVYYLDRDDVKLLPAGGLLWQPNPSTRFDIFFPEPKLARYCTTIGRSDVWWYAAGDYGGGAWTIRRADGTDDSVDMSDLRVMLGLEWGQSEAIRAGRRTAFMELGFVFERDVQYRRNPADNFRANNAVMFRAGFGY